ncbi:Fic family protein [Williamsia sterculiae]|uniref:Fic family protein n=1 Tax=Williamsia sterculiae TaxID=1344003 RepID=A0A1N7FC10_9NOCA|nr:Fic family protein [Williamsia sterculiae]SIR97918.1 Fic family protein [Williamsia sterculiae]
MHKPAPPPDYRQIVENPQGFFNAWSKIPVRSDYLPWDKLRYKAKPDDVTYEELWAVEKVRRSTLQRELPLRMLDGTRFTYARPDHVQRALDEINQRASGQIAAPEAVVNPHTRDKYVIQSLIEEAISSSQLEGASTSRRDAKRMINYGTKPKNRSEQMILNNYRAMLRVREVLDQPLTPELIFELHRIVTEGTLDNPAGAGKMQANPDPADRVGIWDENDELLHRPPPVRELPDRIQQLCDFANQESDSDPYVPDVVRAVAVHFMMGYDHYFEDGNGRTARVLFYWCMLKRGYWLTEHLPISRILKEAPSQYANAYLLTEQDAGDMTYFLVYQLKVICRALDDLDKYLTRKAQELERARRFMTKRPGSFNHRQLELLESATRDSSNVYTAESHMNYHAVSKQTARNDLYDLENRGLLERTKQGREFLWFPVADLIDKLERPVAASFDTDPTLSG